MMQLNLQTTNSLDIINIKSMIQLDYLIKTLTDKRSVLELQLKNHVEFDNLKFQLSGQIDGLNMAITELYKLVDNYLREITE